MTRPTLFEPAPSRRRVRAPRRPAPRPNASPAGWVVKETSPLEHATDLGTAGLWKTYQAGDCVRRVCALPPAERIGATLEELEAWARATEQGEAPAKWSAPKADELRDLPVLNIGAAAVPVEAHVEPHRLAIRATLATDVSSLETGRRVWLDRVLADAHERWQLVRVGIDQDTARAEIDLTGAPFPVDDLFAFSAAAISIVVRWLHPTVHFIVDPDVRSQTLRA